MKSTTLGVRSALPAVSIAYTANVCDPASSRGVVNGDAQSSKGPESMLHTKRDPACLTRRLNVGVWSVDGAGGAESILVSGTVWSTASNAPVSQPLPSGREKPR